MSCGEAPTRYSLINPKWTFDGSIYFGCREPHLPLEYGYAKALLERDGHTVQLVDGQLEELELDEIRVRVSTFQPDFTVLTTAPSYLFWRCAPPELRVPQMVAQAVRDVAGTLVAVGPHASTTPRTVLEKLGASIAVMGECEEVLPRLAGDWKADPAAYYAGAPANRAAHAANMATLPALHWERETIQRHRHHHHRFDAPAPGPGAEMETSRGCPYHCTFCAKDEFRNLFRRRPVPVVAAELDGLIAHGVKYVYFIDEIFLPYKDVLEAIAARGIQFGVQTRIDLWSEPVIDLLGRAGCVSVEAGVESITEAGRNLLDKKCKMSTDEITARLVYAKERIPFVQANLLDSKEDDPREVRAWREYLQQHGVWSNEPVPMFPYPGSPSYRQRWGAPGDDAWEQAHHAYLETFDSFTDLQADRPEPLYQLERVGGNARE